MRTISIATAISAIIIVTFVFMGRFEKNQMIVFGLVLALLSGLGTIFLTINAKIQAIRAKFQPTPEPRINKSSSFRNTTNMRNYANDFERDFESIRQDVKNLQEDTKKADSEIQILRLHMRMCFDSIRYHEEMTLPKALAGQAGWIVSATLLTLLGTALTALPELFYDIARSLYVWL